MVSGFERALSQKADVAQQVCAIDRFRPRALHVGAHCTSPRARCGRPRNAYSTEDVVNVELYSTSTVDLSVARAARDRDIDVIKGPPERAILFVYKRP